MTSGRNTLCAANFSPCLDVSIAGGQWLVMSGEWLVKSKAFARWLHRL